MEIKPLVENHPHLSKNFARRKKEEKLGLEEQRDSR